MRSNFEERVAESLSRHGAAYEYEPWSCGYYSKIRGASCEDCESDMVVKLRWYTPDFVLADGTVIEAKGKLTGANRTKILDILNTSDCITTDNFRLLFMDDNKYGTAGKRYSDWAEQYGIVYHVSRNGEVPLEWLQ